MEYTRLGTSGLKISRIALGCMSFSDSSRMPWALDQQAAEPLFRQALELGITFWDTANIYGHGSSEEIVGHAIMEQVDASLTRLGTDYIDLYQIHRFDPETPIEETMGALHDLVKAGKVRYLGASSMWAWQFAALQHAAELHGWTRFVSMQDQYSLIMREEEREMFGLLAHQGVGSIPWSPLAAGRVARPWGEQGTNQSATSPDTDFNSRPLYLDSDKGIVDAVQAIAEARGVSMAQVSLAWVLKNPVVSAPLVGATKEHHLTDAAAALDIDLADDEVTALEEHYATRQPTYY